MEILSIKHENDDVFAVSAKADTNDIQIMCCLGLYSARLGDIILMQNFVRYIGSVLRQVLWEKWNLFYTE